MGVFLDFCDGGGGTSGCGGGRKKWELWELWDLWENGANEIARGFAKRSKKINHKQRCRFPQTNQLLQQQGQGGGSPPKNHPRISLWGILKGLSP
jgi:hypothetical protein